ncbi:MAG TPA: hypothetical protein VNW53_08305 [Phenylobacterium sp.]|jgi:hypothetical protein|uniref:hypothetical protein n=1 Tax=Phenylobacterium sp. TaxID=1871053 RepID=UPI002CD8EF82|nr:hypothetical protein [Phenylobacterium sp.]HXA38985.1 hypothetical protein [Phenylobacterium sp.]
MSSLDTGLAYGGDALWVIALAVMFAASRHAWGQTAGREKLPFLGGHAPRAVALWLLPAAAFAASLWLVLQARQAQGDMAVIVFGVRAVSAALLALLHLRWVAQALKP